MPINALPIWRDYYVNLGSGEKAQWAIWAPSGTTIYNGIAFRRPGESSIRVKVNDICAAWMRTPAAKVWKYPTFIIQKGLSAREEVSFLYDWSYDPNHDTLTQGMLAPISVHLLRRQLLAFSLYEYDDIDMRLYLSDGTTKDIVITADTEEHYKEYYGWEFALPYGQPDIYNVVCNLRASAFQNAVAVEFGGFRYDIDDNSCSRYALYYMNAYGGWETLLLRGRVSFSESYQRRTYSKDYDNGDMTARGDVNYMNEADTDVVLRTGWLTDEGAGNIHHLTGSTWVYLYDMEEGVFTPLVLTDSSVDKKSYRGEGGQLVSCTINGRIARERIRL